MTLRRNAHNLVGSTILVADADEQETPERVCESSNRFQSGVVPYGLEVQQIAFLRPLQAHVSGDEIG
jgi:hypothetical protein